MLFYKPTSTINLKVKKNYRYKTKQMKTKNLKLRTANKFEYKFG